MSYVSEVSYVEVLGDKSTNAHYGDLILRVLDFIVTILFGVYLVLWLGAWGSVVVKVLLY